MSVKQHKVKQYLKADITLVIIPALGMETGGERETMVTDFDIEQQITGGKKVLMKIGESNMVKVT